MRVLALSVALLWASASPVSHSTGGAAPSAAALLSALQNECTADSDCVGCTITVTDSEGGSFSNQNNFPHFYNVMTGIQAYFRHLPIEDPFSHGTCKCDDDVQPTKCKTQADCSGTVRVCVRRNGTVANPVCAVSSKGSQLPIPAGTGTGMPVSCEKISATKCGGDGDSVEWKFYLTADCDNLPADPEYTFTASIACGKCSPAAETGD